MRRAIAVLASLTVGLAFAAVTVLAQAPAVTRTNGIGFVDYSQPPRFQVGDYVRYHVTGASEMGMSDDYDLTLVITGQEIFWGDSCFWLETWTEPRAGAPMAMATLMSYRIFADPKPVQHLQVYQRKQVNEVDPQGHPIEVLMEPSSSILKTRNLFGNPAAWDVDTLQRDTVITPVGHFDARKISIRQGNSTTTTTGDSTRYDEIRENRMLWYDVRVPITHVARESLENVVLRKTWMIGRSAEGSPLLTRDRGLGSARLIETGHGMAPRITPPNRRFPGAKAPAAAAKPPAKTR